MKKSELAVWQRKIESLAKSCGLDFHPVIFETVSEEDMSAIAAYSGYPIRYHHWLWGQEFIRQQREHKHGLSRIYELVIPTDPVYAYLMTTNTKMAQKLVMAHVYAHADFFKNNVWFRDIPTNLHDRFAANAKRVEKIRQEVGRIEADQFLEACLSLSNLFDPLESFTLPMPAPRRDEDEKIDTEPKRIVSKDPLPGYMRDVLNPPEWLEEERERLEGEAEIQSEIDRGIRIPAKPVRDILGFLLLRAPLESWQQNIVRIIREEQLAFKGIAQTKFMNEGWAAFWHNHIMLHLGAAEDSEIFSFAKMDAGVLSSGGFNPYRLGKELWQDIKWRWDTGRYGAIWGDCKETAILSCWDEFIVFKSLFDKHNGAVKSCLPEWKEFATLINETRNDRGFIKRVFFSSRDFVPEWLCYLNAESGSEDKHRFYRDLKNRIRSGEIAAPDTKIPKAWINWARKHRFDGRLGQGLEKIFEVRETYNDTGFIEDFFTEDFCRRHKYFTVRTEERDDWETWQTGAWYVLGSRDFRRVKKVLLDRLLNLGQPKVVLYDANFDNNGELRLIHLHDGRNLSLPEIDEVLERLYSVWAKEKAVHLETFILFWPKSKPFWERWQPPGKEEKTEPPRAVWVRFSFDGGEVEKVGVSFSEIEPGIKKLLPYIPSHSHLIVE